MAYPSGLTALYLYTSLGYLCRVADNAGSPTCSSAGGSQLFWTANTRDAELHLLTQTAGSGIVTTQTFDPNTGLMTAVQAGTSNAVANLAYSFDTIGNLTARSDANASISEKYCYDALNRLTASATGVSGASVGSCTATGTNIAAKTVGYDSGSIGNITAKSDVGTYTYPASGSSSVRPHAVSSITGTVNGVTNPSYTYDSNGNMTVSAGQTISYTAFNMADTVTQGTTTNALTYDSEHNRVKQVQTVGGTATTTTYINGAGMEEKAVTGGTTTWRDYIIADGRMVAERFNTGGTVSTLYFNGDHLGSTAVLSDGSGAVSERLSYDAWGRRRNSNGTDNSACSVTSATTRGFTGHEEIDAECLINANARIYDPTIARFQSADTIVSDGANGQDFNRYSYVENRPLSVTDPSGHSVIETVVVTSDKWNRDAVDRAMQSFEQSDFFNRIDRNGGFNGGDGGGGGGRGDKGKEPIETVVITAPLPPPPKPPTSIAPITFDLFNSFGWLSDGVQSGDPNGSKSKMCLAFGDKGAPPGAPTGPTYFVSGSASVAVILGLDVGFSLYYNPSASTGGLTLQGGSISGGTFGVSAVGGYQNGGLGNFLSPNQVSGGTLGLATAGTINKSNGANGGYYGGIGAGFPIGGTTGTIHVVPIVEIGAQACH